MSNYNAENISLLEGLEAVLHRPGMYIGSTDSKGVQHCLVEIIDNSVDEHNAGICSEIKVELYEDDSISVTDNGRGIPVEIHPQYNISAATLAVTELHAGGKFGGDNSSYHRTGGLHGVGASVVNALSDWFEMTIYRNGNVYFQRFEMKFDAEKNKHIPAQAVEDLKMIAENVSEKEAHNQYGFIGKTGTKIRFKLNKDKFSSKVYNEEKDEYETEYYSFDIAKIKEKLELLSFLNPKLKMVFINHKTQDNQVWYSENVVQYLDTINQDMKEEVIKPLYYEKEVPPKKGSDKGDIFVRIAFQWYMGDKTKINGFVNNIYTPLGGTHVTGFKKALTKSINNYVKENSSDKEKKEFESVSSEDITEGIVAMVSVKVAEPLFEGQTKDKLSTKEADSAVYIAANGYLSTVFEENPKIVKSIIDRILRSKRAREAAQRAREASNNDKKNIGFSTPSKLADCQSKEPEMCELFLVEGDSAGGSAKMARDKKFQAVLPLKGKILNTQKQEISKVLKSDEINALVSTLGCGIGKNFDITKLRYHKIIYMTDADVDGQHIRTLLSTFFHNYFPDLIKNNHIYTAIPPLYRVKKKTGKDESYYLKDDAELDKFKLEHNMNQWDVSRFKGLGEMNPDQLKETTMSLETREIGLIQYVESYDGEIEETFEQLMGDDSNKRKDFIKKYEYIYHT